MPAELLVIDLPAVTTELDRKAAVDNVGHLRSPGRLSPRILPGIGLLLWLASATGVVIFGQFLLPQALTQEPALRRTSGGVVTGSVVLGVLVCLHLAYWRRVIGHVRAELRLRGEVMGSCGVQLARLRDLSTVRPRVAMAGLWPTQLMALGLGMNLICILMLGAATNALLSPRGSVDSPLLAFLFLGLCLLPFAMAMTVTGYSRMRLARLRAEVEMLGR